MMGLLVSACGEGTITSAKVEGALSPTFANLVQTQRIMMKIAPLDPSVLHASASCHRVGPGPEDSGSGNWQCTIVWTSPGHKTSLRDTYELTVSTDGCYTATADGTDGHVGGPTVTHDGKSVPNLLYAFDACFNPSST